MKMRTVYVYVQDNLADWEAGYAIAELHSGRFFKSAAAPLTVKTCALSRDPVTTLGGVRILPDLTVDEICLSEAALLILPGSDTWLTLQHNMILEKAANFLAAGIPGFFRLIFAPARRFSLYPSCMRTRFFALKVTKEYGRPGRF